MRALYWASYLLSAPFFTLSWVAYGAAWVLDYAGATVHDQTTLRVWRVLHYRSLKE